LRHGDRWRSLGNDALPALIRVCRWDVASLKRAAQDLDRNGLGDLAALVRETIPTIKLKISPAITANRQARKASRRAF
jgi:hypothetical protein